MPSTSKSQQRLFGWALACKRGEAKNCPANVKKLADSMTEDELEDFASTKHEGLPEEVKEAIEIASQDLLESFSEEELNEATQYFATLPNVKPKEGLDKEDWQNGYPGIKEADKYPEFTPSVFKLPGKKAKDAKRRLYDFDDFLKMINYRTHSDTPQNGHGQNLTGKASKEGSGIAPIS